MTTQHTQDAVTDNDWNHLISICMRCLVDPPTLKDLLFLPLIPVKRPMKHVYILGVFIFWRG